MGLQEEGEEKQFVQVQFRKVEPAICCLSSGPKMKNTRSTEQFNQFKMNRGIDMKGHGNDDGRRRLKYCVLKNRLLGITLCLFIFLQV